MLAEELRRLRQEAGLQQTELADRLGVAQSHISRIENGTPTTTTVLEGWIRECSATMTVRRRDAKDPTAPLVELAGALSPEQLARLVRIARALPRLPARTADVLTAAIEGAAEDAGGRP